MKLYEGKILRFKEIAGTNPFYYGDFIVVVGIIDNKHINYRWLSKGIDFLNDLQHSIEDDNIGRFEEI